MGESDGDSKLKADIPYLFYDVIGRMMPGAYFILGILICTIPFMTWAKFVGLVHRIEAHKQEGAVTVSIIGMGLLFFFCAAAFFGFFLASISNQVVEQWIWGRLAPLDYRGMEKFLGSDTARSISTRFEKEFGARPGEMSLNRSSFVCAYYIWRNDVNLGQMQGRQDADLLAAQSFVLVTMILALLSIFDAYAVGLRMYLYLWLPFLVLIGLGSALSFNYHRQKRVYGRFELFLALSQPAGKAESPTSFK